MPPLGLDPKMLLLKALEGRQAVLMVARLSRFQDVSSCLAIVNQVMQITLIRYSRVLSLLIGDFISLKPKVNFRLGPRVPKIFIYAKRSGYIRFCKLNRFVLSGLLYSFFIISVILASRGNSFSISHRRRMEREAKAKIIASV